MMLLFEILAGAWFFAFGAVIGSFLNVVVWRTPRGESIVGPSRCPKCGTAIRWYNNVPVCGWFWLGGRCRDCKLPISPRYPIVEFICGAMFLAVALAELASPAAADSWRSSGFVGTILEPHWPRIVAYGLHMLLLCALLAWALMQVDEQQIPTAQIAGLWLVGLIATAALALPPVRLSTIENLTSEDAISRASHSMMRAVAGLIGGAAIGLPLALLAWMTRRGSALPAHTFAIVVATASVGLFLGPEAIVVVSALAAVLRIFSFLVGLRFAPLRHVPLTMEVFVATLIHICFSERLVFAKPWFW